MADTRFLKKRRQTWYFNIAVPADLREKLGKSTITETLETRDLSKAQKLRWPKVTQWSDAFERHRGSIELTTAEIEDHAWRTFQAYLSELKQRAEQGTYAGEAADDELSALEIEASLLADEAEQGDVISVASDIADIAKRTGTELLPGTPTYRRLGHALKKAKYHAVRGRIDALHGKQWDVPTTFVLAPIDPLTLRPTRPAKGVKARANGPGMRFSEAAERFIGELQRDKRAKVTEQTRAQHEAVYRLFTQYIADAVLEDITREKASEFLADVAKLHPHWGRAPDTKKLSVWELLEKFAKGDKQLSNRTLNRYVSSLSAVFKWARKRGLFKDANPFADQSFEKPAARETLWLPYKTDELEKLLLSPRITTPSADERLRPKRHDMRSAMRWLPLLALFTGMRSNELCQLRKEDVLREQGVWFLRVHADREGERLKTEAAERQVPIR